ncbi:MAG: hypothetical protein QGG09_12745 [Pirellulaceae bacterium]|nr:hypothetical protein [Pirellulaceae bacterium]HJN12782.1 hypothetical protein [Pirellulaceae bacterium]
MRRWIAVVVLTISLIGRISTGHEQPPSSLLVNKNWVRFDLVLGRITATQIRGGHRNCIQSSGATETRRELLSVTAGGSSAPSIRYELTDSNQWLTVEIVRRNEVIILREPQPGTETVRLEFVQPREGNIRVVVGDPERPTATVSSDSVWHLLLSEPELCRQELMPIFDLLRPQWNLMGSTNQIEDNLFRAAAKGDVISLAHVRQLVNRLKSPKFVDRQHADQQLRALGVVVLSQFKQLERATLTREQRQRIDRIEKDIAVLKADTPERIVAWMLNDQSVWLSMLLRQDAVKRQVAAARLSEVHPAANKFDPLAEETQRRKQIEALRLRISARR